MDVCLNDHFHMTFTDLSAVLKALSDIQWYSVSYQRLGRTAILPPPKVVRCLVSPFYPNLSLSPLFLPPPPFFWY